MSMHSLVIPHRTATRFPVTGLAAFFARIRANRRTARDLAMLREIEPHILADIGLDHLMPEEIQRELFQAALWHGWHGVNCNNRKRGPLP